MPLKFSSNPFVRAWNGPTGLGAAADRPVDQLSAGQALQRLLLQVEAARKATQFVQENGSTRLTRHLLKDK